MGGARPVKNAQWYELSVAARLNTHPVKIDEAELDITGFYFDPNHRPYPSTLTNAGYPAEIDVTAVRSNVQYNISCKFSEKVGAILKPHSQELFEAILEFMPLTQIEDSQHLKMNYVLATNFIISRELFQAKDWEFNRFAELSERVVRLGRKRFKNNFNADLFHADPIRRLLIRLYIFTFSVSELEALHEEDSEFQKIFDTLSRRLLNVPKQGLSLHNIIQSDVILLCESSDHEECFDLIIEDSICHIGSLDTIKKELEKILKTPPFHVIGKISIGEICAAPNRIKLSRSISPEGICRILNSILNNRQMLQMRYPYNFYVLPITFDILAFDAFMLAKKIEATQDEFKKVHPSTIAEIQQLGLNSRAIEDITALAYLHGFGYKLPSTDIILDTNHL